jgi:nucleoside-diphosphate-sugar epimerase
VLPVDITLYEARGNAPHDEKSEMIGRGPLGQAQIEWENQAMVEGLKRRFSVTVLRLPALLGEGLTDASFARAIASARAGEPIVVEGRGEEVVEALAVADAARACVLAASRAEARGQVVNVPGHPIRRRNLLRVLAKVSGSRSEVVSAPPRASRGRAAGSGAAARVPRDFWVRGETAKRLLGFSPAVPYDAALRASL